MSFLPGPFPLKAPKEMSGPLATAHESQTSHTSMTAPDSTVTPEAAEQPEPEPQLDQASATFDLDGDPSTFDEQVQIYLCLLATAKRGVGLPTVLPRGPQPPVEPADQLVTQQRLERGLELLRIERRERPTAKGRIFLDPSTPSARTIYRFLPDDLLDEDDALMHMCAAYRADDDSFIDQFGHALIITNCVLPIPRLMRGVSPLEMRQTIVGWLYSYMHPAVIVCDVPLYTYHDDGEVTLKDNLDEYDDNWIAGEIAARALFDIYRMRLWFKNGDLYDDITNQDPWITPDVLIEFPNLGKGEDWVNHLPRYTEEEW